MIPYLQLPYLHVGPVWVSTAHLLIAVGIFLGHLLLLRRARRLGRDASLAAALSLCMVVVGFFGAHLFKMLYLPGVGSVIRRHPWLLVSVFHGMASFGGIFAGLLAGLAYLHWRKLSASEALGYLDMVACVFPFAWIFGRISCSLVHDHPGLWSSSWLAVRYPDGARWDLAVLEVFYMLVVILLFLALDRKPRPVGFYLGSFLLLYGPFRVILDRLHVDVVRYLGWSVDQWAGAVTTLAGLGVWMFVYPIRRRSVAPGYVTRGAS